MLAFLCVVVEVTLNTGRTKL